MDQSAATDDRVPQPLEFFPASGIGRVAQACAQRGLLSSTAEDRTPAVEIPVRSPVPRFQVPGSDSSGTIDHVSCVIEVPIVVKQATRRFHPVIERGPRVRGQDMKRGGFDPLFDGPLDCPFEDVVTFPIHPEDKAGVDHHAKVVQSAHDGAIVATQVLKLTLLA